MYETIQVRIIPKAKKVAVKKYGGGLKVYVTAAPIEGKANKALLEALIGYFKVKKSQLSIIKGKKTKNKLIRISPMPKKLNPNLGY